jgi:hypothetical protein
MAGHEVATPNIGYRIASYLADTLATHTNRNMAVGVNVRPM